MCASGDSIGGFLVVQTFLFRLKLQDCSSLWRANDLSLRAERLANVLGSLLFQRYPEITPDPLPPCFDSIYFALFHNISKNAIERNKQPFSFTMPTYK